MSVTLPILCFNDVYRVTQRYVPQPGAPKDTGAHQVEDGHISVSQFGQLLLSERDTWADSPSSSSGSYTDGEHAGGSSSTSTGEGGEGKEGKRKEGLVLFAGDLYNPSVESAVTRGSHMVPIINNLRVDCACVGNHDFDFGFPHLTKLIESTTFPWLLSNIVDKTMGKVPEPLNRFWVTERFGVRIGVIGLVEEDWIATIPSWPPNFVYRPMKEVALELSKELRDPEGPHKVDIIIALTHCRVPNDIRLANDLGAVKGLDGVEDKQGVDLLIGGHDHIYYIGKGAESWDGFSGKKDVAGTKEDNGVRLIKSGTDFRDLSSAALTLSAPTSKVRRRVVESLTGKHHYILPSSPSSPAFEALLKSLLSSVSSTLSKPVCWTLTPFDARSEIVRTKETGLGNWVADVLLHAYAESGVEGATWFQKGDHPDVGDKPRKERGAAADAVLLCGGTLRGDSQYGPGKITLGDILEILPFEDPVVCIEMDGKGIWDALESALSKWPAQEGRFPIVAGLAVQWNSDNPPNQRINSIHLVYGNDDEDEVEFERPEDIVDFVEQDDGTRVEVKQRRLELGEEVKREEGGREYRIITREYMAQGYDGFGAMKGRKFLIDDENGQIMSTIIRSFLLGSSYIFRHKQFIAHQNLHHLSKKTSQVISRARAQHQSSPPGSLASSPRSARRFLIPPSSPRLSFSGDDIGGEDEESMNGSILFSPGSSVDGSRWGAVRRHVVSHSRASIRDAMHVARNEHMSGVDTLKGDEMRREKGTTTTTTTRTSATSPTGTGTGSGSGSAPSTPRAIPRDKDAGRRASTDKPKTPQAGAAFIAKAHEEELQSLDGELAIVCPLVDGRLRDLAEGTKH